MDRAHRSKNCSPYLTADWYRRKRYSISLVAGIWLTLSLLFGLTVTLVLLLDQTRVQQQAVRIPLSRALSQAAHDYAVHRAQLNFFGNSLVNSIAAKDPADRREQKNLADLIGSAQQLDTSLFGALWDSQEHLLANSGNSPFNFNQTKNLSDALKRALSGQVSSTLASNVTGQIGYILFRPTYNKSGDISGAAALGFTFENAFLRRVPTLVPEQKVLVLEDGQVAYLQPGGARDSESITQAFLATIDLKSPNLSTDAHTVGLAEGNYDFYFVLLSEPSDPSTVLLGIAVPSLSAQALARNLLNPVILAPFFLFLVLGLIGFFYIGSFRSSLQELDTRGKKVLAREGSTTVLFKRPDEIDDAARDPKREQKEWEQGRTQLESYARIANSMGLAALETDTAKNITRVNATAEAVLKETSVALMGMPFQNLFAAHAPEHEAAGLYQSDAVMLANSTVGDSRIVHHTETLAKSRAKVYVISSPISDGKQLAGYVHVLLDRTQEENLLSSKNEFLMYTSHELRAPVARLRTAIDLLSEAFQDRNFEQQHSLLGNMQRSIIQFQFFVESLIDSSSVQSGQFRTRLRVLDYRKIINSVLDQFQPFVHNQFQQIDVSIDLPTPCLVNADSARLVQVIFNLLGNASKYGGEENPIRLAVFTCDRNVITEVTDQGPGIEPSEQEQIFERFYRGKRVEREGMGIGLGLALARTIIEQHGGEIHVRCETGKGTTFWFCIPIVN